MPNELADHVGFTVGQPQSLHNTGGHVSAGVLMLYDTAARGFLEADSTALRVWGQILAPFLAQNVQDSLYDDKEQIY